MPEAPPPPWIEKTPSRFDGIVLTRPSPRSGADPLFPCALFLLGTPWMAWAWLRSRGPYPSGTLPD